MLIFIHNLWTKVKQRSISITNLFPHFLLVCSSAMHTSNMVHISFSLFFQAQSSYFGYAPSPFGYVPGPAYGYAVPNPGYHQPPSYGFADAAAPFLGTAPASAGYSPRNTLPHTSYFLCADLTATCGRCSQNLGPNDRLCAAICQLDFCCMQPDGQGCQ